MPIYKDLLAGLVVGLVGVAFYLSSAALIFQGPLAAHLSAGIGSALWGGALLALLYAWRGSLRLGSVGAVPASVPLMAAMSADIAARSSPAQTLPTVVLMLALTGVTIGACWWWMGRRGAGQLVRFIPYPVIGGFLATTGWLMFKGGLDLSIGPGAWAGGWNQPMTWALLGEAFFMAASLWVVQTRWRGSWNLPVMILVHSVLVHLGLQALSLDTAQLARWLLPMQSQTWPGLWTLWPAEAGIDGSALLAQAPTLATAVLISTVSLLLTASSLELALGQPADPNHDLRLLGLGNVLTGVLGGLQGGLSASRSLLNRDAGALSARSGAVKALVCLAVMLLAGPWAAWIPVPVLGGLFVLMGLEILKTWVLDGRHKLSRSDHAVVLLIVGLAATLGTLTAVVAGVLLCCLDFARVMARQPLVRRDLDRNAWPSPVERSPDDQARLQALGAQLRVIELQGALFFGASSALAERLAPLVHSGARTLVFDFARVGTLDSSAAQGLGRLFAKAQDQGLAVVLSGLPPPIQAALAVQGATRGVRMTPDLAQALRDWEDAQLQSTAADAVLAPNDAAERWLRQTLGERHAQALQAHMSPVALAAGEPLFAQGDASDALYLLRQGRLAIVLGPPGAARTLRLIEAGSVVGEMGVYRQSPRSATVVAQTPAQLWRLSLSSMQAMTQQDPALSVQLNQALLRLLADRLEHANAQVRALST